MLRTKNPLADPRIGDCRWPIRRFHSRQIKYQALSSGDPTMISFDIITPTAAAKTTTAIVGQPTLIGYGSSNVPGAAEARFLGLALDTKDWQGATENARLLPRPEMFICSHVGPCGIVNADRLSGQMACWEGLQHINSFSASYWVKRRMNYNTSSSFLSFNKVISWGDGTTLEPWYLPSRRW